MINTANTDSSTPSPPAPPLTAAGHHMLLPPPPLLVVDTGERGGGLAGIGSAAAGGACDRAGTGAAAGGDARAGAGADAALGGDSNSRTSCKHAAALCICAIVVKQWFCLCSTDASSASAVTHSVVGHQMPAVHDAACAPGKLPLSASGLSSALPRLAVYSKDVSQPCLEPHLLQLHKPWIADSGKDRVSCARCWCGADRACRVHMDLRRSQRRRIVDIQNVSARGNEYQRRIGLRLIKPRIACSHIATSFHPQRRIL